MKRTNILQCGWNKKTGRGNIHSRVMNLTCAIYEIAGLKIKYVERGRAMLTSNFRNSKTFSDNNNNNFIRFGKKTSTRGKCLILH